MSDTERTPEDNDFVEAQEGDYEPEVVIHDPDDLPVDDDEDDDRPVPHDPDDAEIA